MNKRQKTALVINSLIFVFTLFATISVVVGFTFMGELNVLSEKNFKAFRYYTVLSNIFAGLISLAYVIKLLTKKGSDNEKLSKTFYILKLAATTGVTLTMLVTVFFLAPRSKTTYWVYFMNSNFFMHFLTPVLCIISFIFLDPARDTSFKMSLTGIVTMVMYALFYTPNVLLHLDNGKVNPDYDWYGFLAGGVKTVWFVIPLMFFVTWLFSFALWALNKKFAK